MTRQIKIIIIAGCMLLGIILFAIPFVSIEQMEILGQGGGYATANGFQFSFGAFELLFDDAEEVLTGDLQNAIKSSFIVSETATQFTALFGLLTILSAVASIVLLVLNYFKILPNFSIVKILLIVTSALMLLTVIFNIAIIGDVNKELDGTDLKAFALAFIPALFIFGSTACAYVIKPKKK